MSENWAEEPYMRLFREVTELAFNAHGKDVPGYVRGIQNAIAACGAIACLVAENEDIDINQLANNTLALTAVETAHTGTAAEKAALKLGEVAEALTSIEQRTKVRGQELAPEEDNALLVGLTSGVALSQAIVEGMCEDESALMIATRAVTACTMAYVKEFVDGEVDDE